jgi:hypothetical protein
VYSIENKSYTAALRWKKGEMDALRSLDDASKERLLPHIILPPLGARDIEEKRALSRDEFTAIQIGRIQKSWANRPCMIDFRFVKFDPKDSGGDAAWVSEFLATARKYGCRLIPVIDSHTDAYRLSGVAAHIENSKSGGAIRVSLHDLQNEKLDEFLSTLLSGIRAVAEKCVLVVDLGEADIGNVDDFAQFTSGWLTKLRSMHKWKRVIVEASSYPIANPAPKNGRKVEPRSEWLSWLQVIKDENFLGWAQFGDFGADHGHIDFEGGGRTVTHLRYTTQEEYIVERGGIPSFTHDGQLIHDGTIRTVAKRIADDAQFFGERYSAGDEFVSLCSSKEGGPGNATTWRWANMVHHLTLATAQNSVLVGAPFEQAERAPVARQLSLPVDAK